MWQIIVAVAACPDTSWTAANGSCYRLTDAWLTHRGCAEACGPNASLACITSDVENAFVSSLIDNKTRNAWFGLYKSYVGESLTTFVGTGGWHACASVKPSLDRKNSRLLLHTY